MNKLTNTHLVTNQDDPTPQVDEAGGAIVFADNFPDLPLIVGENQVDYEEFRRSCIQAIKPGNIIEETWLQDFIDYAWEAQRTKVLRAAIIQAKKCDAVYRLICDHSKPNTPHYEWSLINRVSFNINNLFGRCCNVLPKKTS